MKKSREILYKAERLNNFKELIERSTKLYGNKPAFKYKLNPKDTNIISITYSDFKEDIDRHRNSTFRFRLIQK